MRVLHVLEATLGGTRRYLENILDAFLQVPIDSGLVYSTLRADAGFHTLLSDLNKSGWSTFQINMCRSVKPGSDVKSLFQLHRAIKAFKPDILHCHSSKAGALGRMAAMLDGTPPHVIYSPHALAVNMRRLYMRVECCLAGATDMFVAVSDSERQQIIDLRLAKPAAVKVVYPCVNTEYFTPMDGQETRRRLELHSGPVVIGIGRLTYQKNPVEFLRVLHRLRADRADVQAIWVGDGELEKEFNDVVRQLRLDKILRIIPWTDDIRPYLAASDITLSTARFESFGYVVAEALAMTKPVVASRITGTVDIL
jgi:glycosyltransferase involved in cell wall biosynthesis